jgi:hypothetical protein
MKQYARVLIVTAEKLVSGRGKPSHADTNRSVSTSYCALYSHVCESIADHVVQIRPVSGSPTELWVKVYRQLDHGTLREQCSKVGKRAGSQEFQHFARAFQQLQAERHLADYDIRKKFSKADAVDRIVAARTAMADFDAASRTDRLEFALHCLVKFQDR